MKVSRPAEGEGAHNAMLCSRDMYCFQWRFKHDKSSVIVCVVRLLPNHSCLISDLYSKDGLPKIITLTNTSIPH